jgi:hypothetical protein
LDLHSQQFIAEFGLQFLCSSTHQFIFAHHLKNPTAIQDDFWILFLNLWIFGFLITSQIVLHTLPGKDHIRISACIGKVPQQYANVPYKKNWALFTVIFLSILFHIGYLIFKLYLKSFESRKLKEFENFKKQMLPNKKIHLYNNLTTFLVISLLVGGTFTVYMLTAMNPEEIDNYPNYVMLYMQDLFIYPCGVLFFLVIFLNKNENVKIDVLREIACMFRVKKCYKINT